MKKEGKPAVNMRDYAALFTEVKTRIRSAQVRATLGANAEMLAMYWDIGRMIVKRQKSEGWGTGVIPRLSRDIRNELPEVKGFSERNIKYMLRFFREYPGGDPIVQRPVAQLQVTGEERDTEVPRPVAQIVMPEDVQRVAAQLPWGHHVTLMEKVKDLPTRYWYMAAAIEQGWSRDVLTAMIKSNAHERQGAAVTNFESRLPAPQSDLARDLLKERMAYFLTQYQPRGQDLFLYVDPYGIKSIRFSHFAAVSEMGFGSVELMLNLNTFGFLREGCRLLKNSALREGDEEEDAPAYEIDVDSVQVLDEIAGGDYWQAIINQYYAGDITFGDAEERFSAGYCERLKGVFAYSLSMPIKTKISNIPKYRIVYGTNHPHGLILMADNMFRRWQEFKECDRKGQMVLFDLDYPEALVDTSSAALKQAIVACAAEKRELSDVLACLIDRFGIVYDSSYYREALKCTDGREIAIERVPELTPGGRKRTAMDYKSKDYKVYILRNPKWQPSLL